MPLQPHLLRSFAGLLPGSPCYWASSLPPQHPRSRALPSSSSQCFNWLPSGLSRAGNDPSQMQDNEYQAEIFASLISKNATIRNKPVASNFVNKLADIPEISLPPSLPRKAAISLVERGLVGQFTGLWPSPRVVQKWVEHNWNANIQGKITIRFCGTSYYTFLFETKEDRNLIFRNGPYFMDSRGLYLNR